ncbi:peptidylprolyl isomerase [bacterium]|nr:peptidylprolyl isomerase [bacterium]
MRPLNLMLFLLFVVSLFSCSNKKEEIFLAKVGEINISTSQYRERLEEIPFSFQAFINTQEGRHQVLEAMIKERLLIVEAKRRKLGKDKEIKMKLKELEESLLLAQMIKEARKNEISVTKEELADYYLRHKDAFAHPRQIRISHILLPDYEKAEEVMSLFKRGRKFSRLAQKMSIDNGSAKQGGDLGFFRQGDIFMLPEFEKVAFSMKNKGDISNIVKTQLGFHIIKLTDIKKLEPQNFNQAKEEIKKKIEKDKFGLWMEELKNKFKVKINYELLNKIFSTSPEEEINDKEKKNETKDKK